MGVYENITKRLGGSAQKVNLIIISRDHWQIHLTIAMNVSSKDSQNHPSNFLASQPNYTTGQSWFQILNFPLEAW